MLFASGSWELGDRIPPHFATLSPELVEVLAFSGVRLVGIDTPSVDPAEAPDLPSHRACTVHNVLIVEGLALEGVEAGIYTLVVAPLRIHGAEASPVRAFLLPEGWTGQS